MACNMIPVQTVFRNKKSGSVGVVCPDLGGMLSCCNDDEVPVVYEGTTASCGTIFDQLEIVGPENALADREKCGAGKGKDCCIFLAVGANGFECQRFGNLRWDLVFRKSAMNAKREPIEMFPNCQF
mgnify:FL=1